ncbi:glycogen synthase GlgA [Limnoglobus roseus]|uniref:Glycogen synthase n=1 Tax=Limnoglobus roseus TaxID=2598579 RepID=A0A5C1A370_9BACT|nr:glycogen synthase GlgA [Limnoglobus roseus]QEL13549.1 GT5 family glycosyltransferase [Limnoglobus roseus]
MSLKILLASSEVVGFAKTGGLADVAGALPRALAARGHQVAVVMPYYRCVRTSKLPVERSEHVIPVPVGTRTLACRVFRSMLPGTSVPIYFIDQPEYFDRDDPKVGRGLYQQSMPGGYKADYIDNAERFVFFSRAVLEIAHVTRFIPDVVHANDWQTGLVPVFLNEIFRAKPQYEHTRSVFTIHNIAYQGMFGREVMKLTALPGWLFNHNQLEFHGHFNFLKAGLTFADAINTVSPTYSREIQTAEYGCGLEGLLRQNRMKLFGIMNGVDYDAWNPATDPYLPKHYDVDTVFEVKPDLKAELQHKYNLPLEPKKPLLGVVARLVSQKGIDLILSAAPGFLDLGCQMVFLGEGDPEYHNELQQFRDKHPQQVGVNIGYSESLAHLIEAGSDLFLMPSRYEPSGLNQLYSMKYGTPPVVRQTGGLADSVVGATHETLQAGMATGFSFGDYTANALYQTIKWAVTLYRDRPKDFQQVVRTAMRQDWSWDRSAADYERLYERVL